MNRNAVLIVAIGFNLVAVNVTHAVQSTNTWLGGTGIYNTNINWSLNVVPQNTGATQHVVRVDAGNAANSVVTVQRRTGNPSFFTVDQVEVDAGDSLIIGSGADIIMAKGGLLLNGTVTLAATNSSAFLDFSGPNAIQGSGRVISGGSSPALNAIQVASGVLTSGPGITIEGAAGTIRGVAGGRIINQGTISATTSGQMFNVENVLNQGRIIGATGALLTVNAFTNTGTILMQSGGSLVLTALGTWSNTGVIDVNGSDIQMLGTFDTASATSILRNGGTITIVGRMVNSNTTFALNASTGSWFLRGTSARIIGGTITTADGAQLIVRPTSGALDGVTVSGSVMATSTTLNVQNNLTLNGALTLHTDNLLTTLRFNGTQSLLGTGQVFSAGSNPLQNIIRVAGGTLTIGPGITIQGTSMQLEGTQSGDLVINQGTITSTFPGNLITLEEFQNQGQLIANGGEIQWFGTATQTVGNIVLNDATLEIVNIGPFIFGGTVGGNTGFLELLGGSVSGSGTISATVTNSGALLPSGKLTIAGGLAQKSGAAFAVRVGGYTPGVDGDLIVASNAVVFAGTLAVSIENDFFNTATNGSSFTVLSASAISGAFDNVASGGTLTTADGYAQVVVTYSGNTLVLSGLVKLDSDSDGLPDAWELDFFPNIAAENGSGDPDGDGFTNLEEFEQGTNPTVPDAAPITPPEITAIEKIGDDIRVTWKTSGGQTNQLQAGAGNASGFTNSFPINVGPQIIVPGVGAATTNATETGGATLGTNRFYRVRVVP